MLRRFLLSTLVFCTGASPLLSQQELISVYDLNESIDVSGKRIILFGENHYGKALKNLYCEYAEILDKEKINTVFLEGSYSSYLISILNKDDKFLKCKCLVRDTNLNIVAVDIEDEPDLSLLTILYIYAENNLFGNEHREVMALYRQYRKTKIFDKQAMLKYINKLESTAAPGVEKYHDELLLLLKRMRITYEVVDSKHFADVSDLLARDSLMAAWIEEYVIEYDVTSWAGIFGSFHILQDQDKVCIPSMETRLFNLLLKNQLVVQNRQDVLCVVYDCWRDIARSDEFESHFITRFLANGPGLRRGELIFDERQEGVVFLISKR